ncbi:MAG: hypothetical protein ACK4VY_01240 [Brevundimonas sp.]
MYFVDMARRGLDADMVFIWATRTPLDWLVGALQLGLIGFFFVVASFWMARLFRLRTTGFILLASLPATIGVLWVALQPTTLVANHLFYPPTWLTPASLGWSLAAAAISYVLAARQLKSASAKLGPSDKNDG